MSDLQTADGPLLAADGTSLKASISRALRRQKIRALLLVAPLFLFICITFLAPIADMLFRSVENNIVPETLPQTTQAIQAWDPKSGEATRVGFKVEDGKKVRVATKSGEVIDG